MDPNIKVQKTLAAASSDEEVGKKNLNDSDSEAEERKKKKMKKKKVKTLVDSDDSDADISQKREEKAVPSSSEDEDEKKTKEDEESNSSRKTKKRKMTRVVDSDSEEGEDKVREEEVQLKKSKNLFANKDLYDAESSEEEDDLPEPGYTSKKRGSSGSDDLGQEEGGAPTPRPRSPKQSRKASEKAMDEIRSESARLLRESAIGLPYHRPKQRSLAEFLARKDGQPEIVSHIKTTRFDPYAQQKLEQREAAMKKFYKDEDDVDEDEEAGAEKVQGAKEVEEGFGELGGNQEEAVVGGESVAPPLLSSVFDEQTAAESELNDACEGSA